MNDATLIADLVRAGIDPDLVGRVANAIAAAASGGKSGGIPVDEMAEKRRAWDRQRKRNSTGIPPDSTGIPQNALSSSSKRKKERAKAELCPVEFHPSDSHYEAGEKIQLSRIQIDSLCDDMRAWSQTNAHRPVARKCDWGLAFHQWIKRHSGERTKTNGTTWAGIEGVT